MTQHHANDIFCQTAIENGLLGPIVFSGCVLNSFALGAPLLKWINYNHIMYK